MQCYCFSLLCRSDHTLVILTAEYIPVIQRQPVTTRLVRKWTQEANEELHDWLEYTNWNTLLESPREEITSMTECTTDFITFCVNKALPVKAVRRFPNNKPWLIRDQKEILNKKERAYRTGDRSELRCVHKGFKKEVGDEENMSNVWSGMKQITGIKMGNDSRKEAWTGIMSPPQNTQSSSLI